MQDDLHRLDEISESHDGRLFLRATAVAMDGQGAVILGQSGAGKTRTALEMMAIGADLISDDGVWLDIQNVLHRPETAPNMIEARGIGLLHAAQIQSAPLHVVVDLNQPELQRLPPHRVVAAPGGPVAFIRGQGHPFLAAAIVQYLKMGRAE